MSSVGHPLADLCNFMNPLFSATAAGTNTHEGFLPGATPGLPDAKQIVKWYAEVSGYDPTPELNWGMAFSLFRLSAICQGIAARYAKRQASSEQAKMYALTRGPLAEVAWELVQKAQQGTDPLAKL